MEAPPGTLQEGRVQTMSKRNEENAAMVKCVFCDAYKFYLKYHSRPMEPGMWQEATDDFAGIMKQYGATSICARIMLATFSQLEEETR